MRVLIDECLEYRLFRELSGHEVKSVQFMGWAGLPDSQILDQAQQHFDVLITKDQNIPYQQNLKEYDLGVIVLRLKIEEPKYVKPLIPQIQQVLQNIQPGGLVFIS